MNLHLISHSPFKTSSPVTHTLSEQDIVLFIGDGCYYLKHPQALQQIFSTSKIIRCLAIEEDCALRGLSQTLLKHSQISSCTSDSFVTLSLSAQHTLNW